MTDNDDAGQDDDDADDADDDDDGDKDGQGVRQPGGRSGARNKLSKMCDDKFAWRSSRWHLQHQ